MSGIRGGAGSTGGSTGGVTGGVTIGVEEEFHLVDPDTGDLVPAARRVLGRGDGEAVPELQRTVVETATGVHTTLDGLRHDLLARRRELAAAAGEVGLVVVAAGTVPASGARTSTVFPDRRYEWMAAEYRQLVDEQQVCACQVHVGVADRDLAVHVTRRIRAWLPVLLAMTASSPFFQQADTGYASYRTVVLSRWPTVGPPPDFGSAAEYDRTVAMLIDSGVISDAGMIYFDARLSPHYRTIEVRVADACPAVDDAVLLAALARGLVLTAARADVPGARVTPGTGRGDPGAPSRIPGRVPAARDRLRQLAAILGRAGWLRQPGYPQDPPGLPAVPQVLSRAANWRAARSGVDDRLIHPLTWRTVPAADAVRALLTHVRPVLEELGDWTVVTELAGAVLDRGPSARRQRAAVRAGRPLARVATDPAAETTAD